MVALAQWVSAHAVIAARSAVTQGVRHFYNIGDIVYKKSDFTQPPGAQRSLVPYQYRVLDLVELTFNDAGTEYYQSLIPTVAATCADAPYSPDTDQLDDTTTPFFYILQRVSDNTYSRTAIHETDCYTETLIVAYIQANLPNWWS